METSAYCGSPRNLVGWCAGPAGPGSNSTPKASHRPLVSAGPGVGAEAMLWSNWLTRIEYRYANYGTFGFTLFPGSGACGVGCDTIAAEATLRTHTVLVGFAYKFGGPFIAAIEPELAPSLASRAGRRRDGAAIYFAHQATHGAFHESRRDRSARTRAPLRDAGGERGGHSQRWTRDLRPGGPQAQGRGALEAPELPGLGRSQAESPKSSPRARRQSRR